MRALVPADTLVYLETNDLAAALQPIVDSKPFAEVAKSRPDLSQLKGVQIAVAVTGFEATETADNVRPRFVVVADTHAWNYQAVRFTEQQLGSFVEDVYNSEAKLERSDAKGGTFFIWSSDGGRKAYALAIDSLIYFGNDETTIDKCLAIRRGEAEHLNKHGKELPPAVGTVSAVGYISPQGVGQIAALLGAKFAAVSNDDAELRDAVVTVIPEEIRSSITDVTWTMTKSGNGIEDRFWIAIPADRRSSEFLAEVGTSLAESILDTSADELADAFGVEKSEATGENVAYVQENRVTEAGVERRTVSDLGFIGWIISQFADD